MEKKIEIKTYMIEYYCDKCGEEVRHDGAELLSSPPKYRHICKCGEVYLLQNKYPYVSYR